MKKKYIYTLALIVILLALVLTIGTGYGLYVAIQDKDSKSATTLNCFKIYYSDTENVYLTNINPVTNEDGKETGPKTITVTNICKDTKELQLKLNILNTTTVDTSSLMVFASGNIEKSPVLYKDLQNSKSKDESVVNSKIIGIIKMEPNETVRTNIKLWFDERKASKIESSQILNAKYELIDTESSVNPTIFDNISSNSINENTININNIATTDEGIYKTLDNDGETYFFRGASNSNYVEFADNIWRIIRINGNKSVRMILDKNISNDNYSEYANSGDYTGLKYVYNNELINNSINNSLNNWYNENIVNKNLDNYVSEEIFCNDTSTTISNYHTYYGSYKRLVETKEATLVCPETNVDYGGTIKQKIGLISVDEVALAGGVIGIGNTNYYLYNGQSFYTESPTEYYNYKAYIYNVNEEGLITSIPTNNNNSGIRPVINLDSSTTVTGLGTKDNPYIVDID